VAIRWDEQRQRYCSEFQQGGIRVFRRMPHGVTKAQAEEWEVKRRRALFDTGPLGNRPELTLAAALQLWLENTRRKNAKQAQGEARQWAGYLPSKLLREAPEVAEKAVSDWRKTAKASTINRRLAALKAAAKYAWKRGWIDSNVSGRITMLREPPGREVYLSAAQVRTLAASAPSEAGKAAIMLAAYTGLRSAELLALPKMPGRAVTLSIAAGKTGKPRIVPVPAPARPFLKFLPLGLTYWQWHSEFDAARKAAKMQHVRPHDLRHTCASLLINRDVDLYTVGRILGHAGPMTTARYSHLADRTLRKAMAKLR
jgi:integrase